MAKRRNIVDIGLLLSKLGQGSVVLSQTSTLGNVVWYNSLQQTLLCIRHLTFCVFLLLFCYERVYWLITRKPIIYHYVYYS